MNLAYSRSTQYGNISSSIKAVAFFGVPHHGADAAKWGSFAAKLADYGTLGSVSNSAFVTALERQSPKLASVSQQAIERFTGVQIRTFYETRKYKNVLV